MISIVHVAAIIRVIFPRILALLSAEATPGFLVLNSMCAYSASIVKQGNPILNRTWLTATLFRVDGSAQLTSHIHRQFRGFEAT